MSSFLAGRKNSSLQTKVDLAGATQRKLTLGQTGNLTIISVANSGAGLRKTQHVRGEDPEPIEIPQETIRGSNANSDHNGRSFHQFTSKADSRAKVFGIQEGGRLLQELENSKRSPGRAPAPLNQFLLGDFQLQSWRTQTKR